MTVFYARTLACWRVCVVHGDVQLGRPHALRGGGKEKRGVGRMMDVGGSLCAEVRQQASDCGFPDTPGPAPRSSARSCPDAATADVAAGLTAQEGRGGREEEEVGELLRVRLDDARC